MATELLPIPEADLAEVIDILLAGLAHTPVVSPHVRRALEQWCQEQREYLARD